MNFIFYILSHYLDLLKSFSFFWHLFPDNFFSVLKTSFKYSFQCGLAGDEFSSFVSLIIFLSSFEKLHYGQFQIYKTYTKVMNWLYFHVVATKVHHFSNHGQLSNHVPSIPCHYYWIVMKQISDSNNTFHPLAFQMCI